jgi:hypothetical protein
MLTFAFVGAGWLFYCELEAEGGADAGGGGLDVDAAAMVLLDDALCKG